MKCYDNDIKFCTALSYAFLQNSDLNIEHIESVIMKLSIDVYAYTQVPYKSLTNRNNDFNYGGLISKSKIKHKLIF